MDVEKKKKADRGREDGKRMGSQRRRRRPRGEGKDTMREKINHGKRY